MGLRETHMRARDDFASPCLGRMPCLRLGLQHAALTAAALPSCLISCKTGLQGCSVFCIGVRARCSWELASLFGGTGWDIGSRVAVFSMAALQPALFHFIRSGREGRKEREWHGSEMPVC